MRNSSSHCGNLALLDQNLTTVDTILRREPDRLGADHRGRFSLRLPGHRPVGDHLERMGRDLPRPFVPDHQVCIRTRFEAPDPILDSEDSSRMMSDQRNRIIGSFHVRSCLHQRPAQLTQVTLRRSQCQQSIGAQLWPVGQSLHRFTIGKPDIPADRWDAQNQGNPCGGYCRGYLSDLGTAYDVSVTIFPTEEGDRCENLGCLAGGDPHRQSRTPRFP